MDAMFASHIISKGPKPSDEYRIILLGDSSAWGFEIPPQDTLSEQINRLNLQTRDGRRIRVYNLSYPRASSTRDLVILAKAMDYQPDLVLWLVTLGTFFSQNDEKAFLVPMSDNVLDLIHRYHLVVNSRKFLHRHSLWDQTLIGSAARLKKISLEQLYGLLLTANGLDANLPDSITVPPPSGDVQQSLVYANFTPSTQSKFLQRLDFKPLSVAQDLAGSVPILIVNEPMFRATGENSDLRYNVYYPRWAYDGYRSSLTSWIEHRGGHYLDLWDVVPNNGFMVSPLHLRPTGEALLANHLVSAIQDISSGMK
jgi:hypothetical protein